MRFVSAIVVIGLATSAQADWIQPSASVSTSASSTASVLLSRLGGVPAFTSGSASPTQRNLVAESSMSQSGSNTIYYASLKLTLPVLPPLPGVTEGDLGDFTDPGDSGVVTGGGGGGSATGGREDLPVVVPSPAAGALALVGLAMISPRRRRIR